MTKLLDVAPSVRTVETKKYGEIDVEGIGIDGIAHLIRKFPVLIDAFQGKMGGDMGIEDILSHGPDVVAEFLAAGLGYVGNKEAVARCKAMGPEDVLSVGHAIFDETFPGGVENFIERLTAAIEKSGLIEVSSSKKASSTPSRRAAKG